MAEDYGLDLHESILLEEFRERRPLLEQLQKVVMEMLRSKIKDSGLELNAIESRIKEEKSLVGKLQRKGHKYHSIKDITDLFGARIVTFYNEDVDRIASMAETLFSVDWANSVDKRKMHEVTSFGYNSLHYICRLPKELYDDPEYPELDDFGDCTLTGKNGTTNYFRVDWFNPDGLRTWGDGRTFILGTEGFIEIRKYINLAAENVSGNHVFLVNGKGEQYFDATGKTGFPFFGGLILDCLNRTEKAMTQAHAFKAAELCLKAQEKAVMIKP